jgi:putative FmdB family regulatory protein
VPLYEYKCIKCGHRFEKIERVTAPHRQKCPKCGSKAERLLSSPAIQFKGSGWYKTDYAVKSAGDSKSEKLEAGESKETKSAEGKVSKEKKEAPVKESTKKGHKQK